MYHLGLLNMSIWLQTSHCNPVPITKRQRGPGLSFPGQQMNKSGRDSLIEDYKKLLVQEILLLDSRPECNYLWGLQIHFLSNILKFPGMLSRVRDWVQNQGRSQGWMFCMWTSSSYATVTGSQSWLLLLTAASFQCRLLQATSMAQLVRLLPPIWETCIVFSYTWLWHVRGYFKHLGNIPFPSSTNYFMVSSGIGAD